MACASHATSRAALASRYAIDSWPFGSALAPTLHSASAPCCRSFSCCWLSALPVLPCWASLLMLVRSPDHMGHPPSCCCAGGGRRQQGRHPHLAAQQVPPHIRWQHRPAPAGADRPSAGGAVGCQAGAAGKHAFRSACSMHSCMHRQAVCGTASERINVPLPQVVAQRLLGDASSFSPYIRNLPMVRSL